MENNFLRITIMSSDSPKFQQENLTDEQVLKTPFKYVSPDKNDEIQCKALDWVVEWANKEGLQLVFINIVKPELSKEEEFLGDAEYIHVNAIYQKKPKTE